MIRGAETSLRLDDSHHNTKLTAAALDAGKEVVGVRVRDSCVPSPFRAMRWSPRTPVPCRKPQAGVAGSTFFHCAVTFTATSRTSTTWRVLRDVEAKIEIIPAQLDDN